MNGFTVKDFLGFEKLLASRLIKLLYFLGLIGLGLSALVFLGGAFTQMRYDTSGALGRIVLTAIGVVIGAFFWRLMCEGMILLFAMYDRLGEIRDHTEAMSREATPVG